MWYSIVLFDVIFYVCNDRNNIAFASVESWKIQDKLLVKCYIEIWGCIAPTDTKTKWKCSGSTKYNKNKFAKQLAS